MKIIILAVLGISSGVIVSAGIFTVLLAVGLTPRYAGKTNTAKYIMSYESSIVWGAAIGCLFSVFPGMENLVKWIPTILAFFILAAAGVFIGIFVGTLSIAIAELLSSFPVFARRIGFRHGLGFAVTAIAFGKMAGSLFYFWNAGLLFPG